VSFVVSLFTAVDMCADNNGGCSPLATCTNTLYGRKCTCNDGYTGSGFTCTGEMILLAHYRYKYSSYLALDLVLLTLIEASVYEIFPKVPVTGYFAIPECMKSMLLVFCFLFCFLNQKNSKSPIFLFLVVFLILFFSYKFCAQTIRLLFLYYNFIFNLHEFTLPLASAA